MAKKKDWIVIETQTRTLIIEAKNKGDAIKKARDLRYDDTGVWAADCPEYIAEECDDED
jgi:hypothetical protein